MVLDEPTNHLDIRSKEVLKDAIQRYDGTLIVVSHDRDFLEGLTDKVIEFNKKQLKLYLGDVKYFLKQRALDTFREVSLGKAGKGQEVAATVVEKKPKLEGKAYHQRLKQVTKDVQNAERKINRLEEDNKKLEQSMADMSIMGTPAYDELVLKYETNKQKLTATMEKWENASLELEELEEQ